VSYLKVGSGSLYPACGSDWHPGHHVQQREMCAWPAPSTYSVSRTAAPQPVSSSPITTALARVFIGRSRPDHSPARLRNAILALVLVSLVLIAAPANAHPGGLDKDGCHHVHTRFVYKNGRVVEPGEYHCHRPLDGGMALDGKEALPDEDADDKPPTPPPPALAPTLR